MFLQFYIELYTSKYFCIYSHLPVTCFRTTPFGICSNLCITMYFVVVCTFAFAAS